MMTHIDLDKKYKISPSNQHLGLFIIEYEVKWDHTKTTGHLWWKREKTEERTSWYYVREEGRRDCYEDGPPKLFSSVENAVKWLDEQMENTFRLDQQKKAESVEYHPPHLRKWVK